MKMIAHPTGDARVQFRQFWEEVILLLICSGPNYLFWLVWFEVYQISKFVC